MLLPLYLRTLKGTTDANFQKGSRERVDGPARAHAHRIFTSAFYFKGEVSSLHKAPIFLSTNETYIYRQEATDSLYSSCACVRKFNAISFF